MKGVELKGEAGDVPESIAAIRKTEPDLIILDLPLAPEETDSMRYRRSNHRGPL